MNTTFSPRARLCGIVLLVLAFSPLTAPFSTLALSDLLSDAAPSELAVLVQAHSPTEKPAAVAAAIQHALVPMGITGALLPSAAPFTSRVISRDLPLRI